jgi:hypothetical protein
MQIFWQLIHKAISSLVRIVEIPTAREHPKFRRLIVGAEELGKFMHQIPERAIRMSIDNVRFEFNKNHAALIVGDGEA